MNYILSIFVCFSFLLIERLNGQASVCSYETNIDYYISTDISYAFSKDAASCCVLCGFQKGCIGKLINDRDFRN